MEDLFYSELSIIQETKKLLETYGESEIVYATAEFAPFSNQRRPDLQFTPNTSEDSIYFIEYKFKPANGFDEYYFKSILEHREFVQEDTDIEIKYAFATNSKIENKHKQYLLDNNITVFTQVRSARELSDFIMDWCNLKT